MRTKYMNTQSAPLYSVDMYLLLMLQCLALLRVTFQEKMQVVHQFMYDHKLGSGLLERVDAYFNLLWRQFR